MPFGVKKWATNFLENSYRAFGKYYDQFMKIFLDNFAIYSDMESYLMKFKLCFKNAKNIELVSI
jgi:hypothetical protein